MIGESVINCICCYTWVWTKIILCRRLTQQNNGSILWVSVFNIIMSVLQDTETVSVTTSTVKWQQMGWNHNIYVSAVFGPTQNRSFASSWHLFNEEGWQWPDEYSEKGYKHASLNLSRSKWERSKGVVFYKQKKKITPYISDDGRSNWDWWSWELTNNWMSGE